MQIVPSQLLYHHTQANRNVWSLSLSTALQITNASLNLVRYIILIFTDDEKGFSIDLSFGTSLSSYCFYLGNATRYFWFLLLHILWEIYSFTIFDSRNYITWFVYFHHYLWIYDCLSFLTYDTPLHLPPLPPSPTPLNIMYLRHGSLKIKLSLLGCSRWSFLILARLCISFLRLKPFWRNGIICIDSCPEFLTLRRYMRNCSGCNGQGIAYMILCFSPYLA